MSEQDSERQRLDAVIDARLRRLGDSRAFGSPGSVQAFAAIAASGFEPVGHVLGSTVLHLGNLGSRARCSGAWSYTGRTDLASANGPFQGLRRRLDGARRLTLGRALAECSALRADGVVGARSTVIEHGPGVLECTVQGTAVRARGRDHLERPFSTHVPAPEFAILLHGGWVPVSVVYGVAIGSRHDDAATYRQRRRRLGAAGNGEVGSYTLLVNDTRRDARNLLRDAVRKLGGDGVVVGEMTLRIDERECPTNEGQHDHVAEAVIAGTALASFTPNGRPGGATPLMISSLGTRPGTAGTPTPVSPAHVQTETAEKLVDHPTLVDRAVLMWKFRQARKDPFSRNQGD